MTTCTDVTLYRRIPGTGIFEQSINETWEASARSIEGRGKNAPFRYSFDPLGNSAYFTGLFDFGRYPSPTVDRYIVAVEIQALSYRIWFEGEPAFSSYRSWSPGDRFHVQQNSTGRYSVYVNDEKVWSQ